MSRINGNHADVLESVRLIRKFFPESKVRISETTGLDFYSFIECMFSGSFKQDYSCEPFGIPEGPRLELSKLGGFEGDDETIYLRLLKYTKFQPKGRAVIVPDALGINYNPLKNKKPFVCSSKSVANRISDYPGEVCFFDGCSDIIFVFESGEAFAVDHDERFYWSKSKLK